MTTRKRFLVQALVACCVFGFVGALAAQPIVSDGLTVYYDFDDFVDEVVDKSGNDLHGEIFGDVMLSQDAVRGAGSGFFDPDATGSNNGIAINGCDSNAFLACEDIPEELIPSSEYTVAAWVNVDQIGGDASVFQPWSQDGSFVNHAQLQSSGKIRFRLRGQLQSENINGTEQWWIDGSTVDPGEPYPVGEWFHYAGTYSMTDNLIRFYYNGEKIIEMEPELAVELGDWGQAATIGIVPDSRGRQLIGMMDEFYVFHRALSEDEIGLLYNLVEPGGPPRLEAGDSDEDLDFDQFDLIRVQQAAKYLTGAAATWGEGDWNGAPGGSQGSPPTGDGLFNQLDIISALNTGLYLQGPYAALATGGSAGDGQTSIGYNPTTGEVFVDAPAGRELTSINIDSAASIFTGTAAENLGGSFDNDADNNIFKATFGSSFGSLSFGNVAQPGLSQEFVLADLTAVGSLAGGGDLGNVDLIYVPEPSTIVMLVAGALLLLARRRF